MRKLGRRKTALLAAALLFVCAFGWGGVITALGSGSETGRCVEIYRREGAKAAAAENLDKQLGVIVASPREIDKGDTINVVAAGVRLGKAVLVNATNVTIRLQDREGFTLGLRRYRPGAGDTDYSARVIEAHEGIYLTSFPALETSGLYTVRVDMAYSAPWGETIRGFTEKGLSVQSWFNISSILVQQKEATQETITNVMGGAADIIRGLSDRVSDVANGIGQISSFVSEVSDLGLVDPAEMTFYPIFLDDFQTQADMGSRLATPPGASRPRALDPQANFQAFVDSLGALVEKGIPFEALVVRDIENLKAFCAGANWSGGSNDAYVSDENPLEPGHYLSFHPDLHFASDWIEGKGRGSGSARVADLRDPVPYRNILLSTYENWFPITEGWTDYSYNNTAQAVSYGDSSWNGTRWIKQIAYGMDRNFSLFYNIKGEPFRRFFNAADEFKSFDDYNPWGGTGEAFAKFNDFATFTRNGTYNPLETPIDPNVREGVGGHLDTIRIYPYEGGEDPSVYAALTGLEEGGDWVGAFFGATDYPKYQRVENYSFAVRKEYVDSNAYEAAEMYASAAGMVLSPGMGFGYTSLENTTLGLTMLHGLYYKIVGDAVMQAKARLDESAKGLIEEHPSIASDISSLRQEILDGWYGTEDQDYQNRYDLPRINDAMMEIERTLFTGPWANDTIDTMEDYGRGIDDAADNASRTAVETDEALRTAGEDVHFSLFGDIIGAAGGFFENVAGAAVNGFGALANGALGLGRFFAGDPAGASRYWDAAGQLAGEALGNAGGMFHHAASGVSAVVRSLIKNAIHMVMEFVTTKFSNIGAIIEQIQAFRADVKEAIQKTLNIVQDLINATAKALDKVADTIDNITTFINAFVGKVYDELINHANRLQESLQEIKTEVLQSTGFYFKIRDSMYKMIDRSEFASGLLRYASEQFGPTDEVFFKEVDVLRPMALLQSGDSGLYVVQLGNEVLDEVVYVTFYRGELVNVDDINATYQTVASSPIGMRNVRRVYRGIYIADFALATERDWMTRCEVTHTTEEGKSLGAFIVERTTKREPSLQPDAYPEIAFDPAAVTLRTGETFVMHIGVRNLMYSKPNVTVRAELISALGSPVGIREQMISLNPEGFPDKFIDLAAHIPFYVPPGSYTLIVKVVEDNGDVTRVAYTVKVVADNFFMGLIGGLMSIFGVGTAAYAFRKRGGSRETIAVSRSLLPGEQCAPGDYRVECDLSVGRDDFGDRRDLGI
jgi:hypothetical protein